MIVLMISYGNVDAAIQRSRVDIVWYVCMYSMDAGMQRTGSNLSHTAIVSSVCYVFTASR